MLIDTITVPPDSRPIETVRLPPLHQVAWRAVTQAVFSLTLTVVAVGISILWFRTSIGRYHPITVGL